MTAVATEELAQLRDQINTLMEDNRNVFFSRKLDYKCHADTTRLEEKRFARTGGIPAGRFRVYGIVAEEKIRQMHRDTQRRYDELENMCQFQRDLLSILKDANDGGDIPECWKRLHRLWEEFTKT